MGVGTGGKCLWNRDSVCLAQDTVSFRFWTTGHNLGTNGPKLGQQTPFGGKIRTKHDQMAAHTLLKWIRSMNGEAEPHWRLSQSFQAPFLVILGRFWPRMTHLGRQRRNAGRNAHSGAEEDPYDDFLGSQFPSGLWNPNGTFQLFCNFGLFQC